MHNFPLCHCEAVFSHRSNLKLNGVSYSTEICLLNGRLLRANALAMTCYFDFFKNIAVLSNSITIVSSGFLPIHLIRTMPALGLDLDSRFSMISLSA